jgi:hypothetical protein
LDDKFFKTVVDSALLASIDISIKKDNKFLLGRRINKPVQGYFFQLVAELIRMNSLIIKDLNELNIELKYIPKFIDVFEHFYKNVSTHYVDIVYEYEVK